MRMQAHQLALCLAGAVSLSAPAKAQTAQPAPPPPACTAPEHRQFDFWVGEWDVFQSGQTERVAQSRIERMFDNCVIRETWMPVRGGGGGSLNHFDSAQGRWHQTWIDSRNNRVIFEGGPVDGKMVLTGFWKNANGPGKDGLVRMTYSRVEERSVRQFGEISTDHGVTWSPFFDLTYRPRGTAK